MKFKCNLCDKSGSLHQRCKEYYDIKAENDRIRELKYQQYENKTVGHLKSLNRRGV